MNPLTLLELKKRVLRWSKSLERHYDRMDAVEWEDKDKIQRSKEFVGARDILISEQSRYIEALEARLERLNAFADLVYRLAGRMPGSPMMMSKDMSEDINRIFTAADTELAESNITLTHTKVVCLCGSTRFNEAFQKANFDETLAGNIVLTIGCDMKSDAALFAGMTEAKLGRVKANLDRLHLRKIDKADEVLILNVGGYIGESTKRELEYAKKHGKKIRFLEPHKEAV